MALTDWTPYLPVLEQLAKQASAWQTAKTYQDFSDSIDLSCADLWAAMTLATAGMA